MSNWADAVVAPAASYPGRWFDGQSPVGRDATVAVTPAGLRIRSETTESLWPWSEVIQTRGAVRGEPVQFERRGQSETVAIPDPGILSTIRAFVPEFAREVRTPSRISMLWRIGLGIVLLVLTGWVIYVWVIPEAADQLAQTIPVDWEKRFGAAVMQTAVPPGRVLDQDAIVGPVDVLVQRLKRANPNSRHTYQVTVTINPEVNAFAGPGGYIVIYRGLLEFTRTPDELAAVIAHEMEHVELRHVTRGIFQRMALSAVLAVVLGNSDSFAGQAARTLGELSYSRNDEAEADREGLRLLEAAGGDGRAMAAVLERMESSAGAVAISSFLSTHPDGAERAQVIRESASGPKPGVEPLLLEAEWNSLKTALNERASASPGRAESRRTPSTPP